MTLQEFYDKTAAHLREQGTRSVADDGTCLYRGPNGTSCAIGYHIPDEIYKPEMDAEDGIIVYELVEIFPQVAKLFSGLPPRALREMQIVHDHYMAGLQLEHGLAAYCEKFGLTYTPPKEQA